MEYFRFTLFNDATLLIVALTLWTAVARHRNPPPRNWPLAYYAVITGYTFGFDGSFNKLWIAGGLACSVLIRAGLTSARWAELIFFAYVLWRSVCLLLLW